ncbi:hypothetical protein KC19_12G041800 [Ceratodon purpureus]|uniref:non-specific serine/threonine protein kinase n=1 Tax=Ceratodon purpureus TaxID=3225 RepID=A0A8T0G433_CERPU|nr:hypothetical protein KC19_12G041800 [Ceratodon purpureus]
MTSLTDDDDTEEIVQDAAPNKRVQSEDLISGRLLGKGSSSIVYETSWKGKSYARKDFLRVPSDIFEGEARALVRLDDHPNVVRTYCWTVDEGSCSLVIELMDDDLQNLMQNRKDSARKRIPGSGPSDASQTSHVIDLHRFIEDGKNAPVQSASEPVASTLGYRFSMSEALHIMLQIAEGIVFLHENGVAHGDLKPKNILVSPYERGISGSLDQNVAFQLKVADFGLVGTKLKSKSLVSQQALKLETVRWRAPELLDKNLLREDEHGSFTDSDWDSDSSDGNNGGFIHKFTYGKLSRADVYSFAVTCSQILTGEDPYSGLGLNDLVRKISGPNGLRPGLPRGCPTQLRNLINRCWGEELKRPTFIDILRELKDLQASHTTGSFVDFVNTTILGPDYQITVSLKIISEKFAKDEQTEKRGCSSNLVVPPLPRGYQSDLPEIEVGLPIKTDRHSIKFNEENSRSTFGPKKRRRRKVYGCLGGLGSSKDNEYIPTPTKRSAKNAKSHFGKDTSRQFSPNDKRYNSEIGRTIGAKPYTSAEVTAMTRNFKTQIGIGSFGPIYYGKLPDRQEVAVKVGSSPQLEQEFFNEIDILSRVRHKNLVALLGYCQEKKYYILIYEYMKNGSLYDYLHGNAQRAGMLDWKMRLQIGLNVAQGLEYLHTGCEQIFVHGDMKSSNILLSAKLVAKLGDFGLTKPMREAGDSITSILTQPIKGTIGYFDPEYLQTNALSPKKDIYSLGVILLELITGRPPFIQSASGSTQGTSWDWVRAALKEGNIDMVLDPVLKSSVPAPHEDALWRVAEIAVQCVEPKGVYRPALSEVIHVFHQAMNLEGRLDESRTFALEPISITRSYVKQTESPKPTSSSGISWLSEYNPKLQPIEKPDLGSASTNSERVAYVSGQRRRKASTWLERLGCIPVKAMNMGTRNDESRAQNIRAKNVKMAALFGGEKKNYTYADVTAITENFKRRIGVGGFGPVYYGKFPDGREVAVKVCDLVTSRQGDMEFFNEITVLSQVHHKNLVLLLGYCLEKGYNILIYEYVANGSLYDYLHGNAQRPGMLDWRMRLQIGLDVAQGLEYLHVGCTPSLIHRDVKSSNILLSAKYDAKVTDFGLSKLMNDVASVMTQVKGTMGYLDPEYYSSNHLSSKSDVFGFGVVLLELVTGRPPIQQSTSIPAEYRNMSHWVRTVLSGGGDIDTVLDPVLKSSVPAPNVEALWKVTELALQCVEAKGVHRPTMSEVVQELREAISLQELEVPLP